MRKENSNKENQRLQKAIPEMKIKDFVSTFKKPKQPKPTKTVADEIKRLNKNEKYKMYYENKTKKYDYITL